MEMESLKDLFIEQLHDIYNAENQLTKALPKMAKNASSPELKSAFEEHLKQTEGHIERLNGIFEELEEKNRGPKCKAMEGLIQESKELMQEDADDDVRDAGLICAAQKIEHYEIATYGCLKNWAEMLGMNDVAEELDQTLTEEKETDDKLTQLAKESVNAAAIHQ